MKRFFLIFALAALAIVMPSSCKKAAETKTMAEILATNPDIPEVDNTIAPTGAWVNSKDSDCKAFIGFKNKKREFIMLNVNGGYSLGMYMTDSFEKTDDNTYTRVESGSGTGTFIVRMTGNKFTSFEFQPESGSRYEQLAGTYAAPAIP